MTQGLSDEATTNLVFRLNGCDTGSQQERMLARDVTVPERRSKARHDVKTLPGETDTH